MGAKGAAGTESTQQREKVSELLQQCGWDSAEQNTLPASTGRRKATVRETIGPGRWI